MLQQCNTYVICPVDDAVGDETCQPKTSINIWQWCEWSNKKNKNTMSSVRTVPNRNYSAILATLQITLYALGV